MENRRSATRQNRFMDLEQWGRERCWVILRLPCGQMRREGGAAAGGDFLQRV